MKKVLLGLIFFSLQNVSALNVTFEHSAQVVECHGYLAWTGLCDGKNCEFPAKELAERQVLREVEEMGYLYMCEQVADFAHVFKQESNNGIKICLSTTAKATFNCQMSW